MVAGEFELPHSTLVSVLRCVYILVVWSWKGFLRMLHTGETRTKYAVKNSSKPHGEFSCAENKSHVAH